MIGKSRLRAPQGIAKSAAIWLAWLPVLLAGCGGGGNHDAPASTAPDVAKILTETRAKFGVPALAAAYVTSDSITAQAVGIRKVGASAPVTTADKFHLASCSKSMLATAAARLVQSGQMGWDFTVSQAFPEFAAQIDPALKNVTLEQLLSHRSGLTAYETDEEFASFPNFSGSLAQQRRAFARYLLTKAPAFPVGEFNYSNGGYGVAAAMLEAKTGQSYEKLIQNLVFSPLGGKPVFGWPAQNGAPQPWGHTESEATPVVFTLSNPNEAPLGNDVIGASGDVSLSAEDWGRYVQLHLRGLRGQNGFLTAATIRKMHTPAEGSNYGLGWFVADVNGIKTSYHAGTVGTFFSFVAIQPSKNRAVVTVSNSGGEKGARAALETLERILNTKVPPEILG